MDTLQDELKELKAFIAELKADRAAQKEKEKKEAWTKYTSLSLVVLAVLAAVATQWGGKYSSRVLVNLNDATFNQSKASDQWSFYQSKSIKQNIYELARDQAGMAGGAQGDATKNSEFLSKKIEKYNTEKNQIQEEAKKLEAERDRHRDLADIASKHGGGMGTAVSILQIAIALGSICLVTKKKPLWYISMLLGVAGAAQMVWVWLK